MEWHSAGLEDWGERKRAQKGAKRALDGFDEIRLTALKGMAGTTRLELATSAVTGQQRRATYWISTVPTARSWSSKKLFAPAYRTQIEPKTEHSEMSPLRLFEVRTSESIP